MNYSIIQRLQLEGAKRLDAEYYQPEYLKLREGIRDMGFFTFEDIMKSFGSGKNLPQVEDGNFTKFIRTQNVRPICIDKTGLTFTREKNFPKLNYGEILFVRVGEGVGNSSIVTKDFEGSTYSDNVIRVKIIKINPFYISVLLNSKIGFLLIEQIKKGSARSLISKENLNSLKIPIISVIQQNYFENIVNQAEDFINESEKIYQQAENLLLEELKIDSASDNGELGFVANLSDIKENNRCDAEYFQPKYRKILEHIKKNCGGVALGDLVTIKKGIEPGAEEYLAPFDAEVVEGEKGKQFIRVSSLSKFGINDNDQKYLSEELYQKLKDDFEPKKDEILLTKDASPGIAYVLKEDVEGIMAGGILRLKLKNKEIEDEYLALCVNSIVGQMQVERDAGGSVIAHWRPDQVKNILIPILPKPIQQKISDLIRQSHESRKKAKGLLEEAKRKVEELIEKGGV